ncbi:MAG: 16S rRNA (guanine(966)-N(2))-methyltransferase RsmD [Lentisphaeraceae bacterium]|nr:16S rRNA (guanine(966)-N(2))-methyltransferase RsmD [Lentisphaeraceae bacterium]
MRIIAGDARGIKLEAGPNEAVRPTTDRIKESVFNIIGEIDDCVVVDIFAGSGALGLEAFSRGAEEVYFIERDRVTCKVIEKNLKKVEKATGDKDFCKIIQTDYQTIPTRLSQVQPDLVLADPPYDNNCVMAIDLLKNEALADWAGSECILCLEHLSNTVLPTDTKWQIFRRKDFGQTAFTFWQQKDPHA